MITEYQRQNYLHGLGIETYVPRWLLLNAPQPFSIELPSFLNGNCVVDVSSKIIWTEGLRELIPEISAATCRRSAVEVLEELVEHKTATIPVVAAPLVPATAVKAEPFALTIWRMSGEFLVIDSRDSGKALPTNRLLQQIMSALYRMEISLGQEEVFRWPLAETESLSTSNAYDTLYAWLDVETEHRPVRYVFLFGEAAAQYLLPSDRSYAQSLWQWQELSVRNVQALISPSLIELLQKPLLKRHLWHCLSPLLQGNYI